MYGIPIWLMLIIGIAIDGYLIYRTYTNDDPKITAAKGMMSGLLITLFIFLFVVLVIDVIIA